MGQYIFLKCKINFEDEINFYLIKIETYGRSAEFRHTCFDSKMKIFFPPNKGNKKKKKKTGLGLSAETRD